MATIKPFTCVRPNDRVASMVAALPYDVFSEEEARSEVQRHKYSFLQVDRAETCFQEPISPYEPKVYQMARERLDGMMKDGTLVCDVTEGYYIYQLTMQGRKQTGIVACASVEDYMQGIIKKHENTRTDKEADRVNHVNACNAQTGPIFLAYRAIDRIDSIVKQEVQKECLYQFVTEDEIEHRVWKITDELQILSVTKEFAKVKEIYIADGHHRAAAAALVANMRRGLQEATMQKMEITDKTKEENASKRGDQEQHEYDYFLSVLFPHDELKILPYNRCVKDLNHMTKEEFLLKLSKHFEVERKEQIVRPSYKGSFGMYLDGDWYQLKLKDSGSVPKDAVSQLDVSILQQYVLDPILEIKDPRTDKRIEFIGGIRGEEELVRRVDEDMAVAFCLYPTSIEELFSVSDANLLMPPKSTWFEPKLRSGLFIHQI